MLDKMGDLFVRIFNFFGERHKTSSPLTTYLSFSGFKASKQATATKVSFDQRLPGWKFLEAKEEVFCSFCSKECFFFIFLGEAFLGRNVFVDLFQRCLDAFDRCWSFNGSPHLLRFHPKPFSFKRRSWWKRSSKSKRVSFRCEEARNQSAWETERPTKKNGKRSQRRPTSKKPKKRQDKKQKRLQKFGQKSTSLSFPMELPSLEKKPSRLVVSRQLPVRGSSLKALAWAGETVAFTGGRSDGRNGFRCFSFFSPWFLVLDR